MDTEQQYIKGFNTGYILTKYEPVMLDGMVKSLPPIGDFFQGFFAGKGEVERENIERQLDAIRILRIDEHGLTREI